MAKLVQKNQLSLVTLASTFKTSGAPVTDKELFYSYDEAVAFAASNIAYVGQIVTVIQSNTVTHYSVQVGGTLKEVGSKDIFLEQLKHSIQDPVVGAELQALLAASDGDPRFVIGFNVTGNASAGFSYEPYFTTLDDGVI